MKETPTESNHVEVTKPNASSSNQQLEDLPENKDDEFKKAKEVKIKFGQIKGNKYEIDACEEYGKLKKVNVCRNYTLRKTKFKVFEVDNEDVKKKPVEQFIHFLKDQRKSCEI